MAKRFGVAKPVIVATQASKMQNSFAKDERKNGEMPKSKDLHKEGYTNEITPIHIHL